MRNKEKTIRVFKRFKTRTKSEIRNGEEKVNEKNLIYRANKYKYDFQQYETIRSFGEKIYTGKTNIDELKIY